jgi:hypothetical protein
VASLEVLCPFLGIASTALSQLGNIQSKFQQVQGEFKTLGQDLTAGNLAQAQTDFVTLSQSVTSQLTSSSPVAKTVDAVGQALQSGNLPAAQQAFASIPSTIVGPSAVHHHHAHGSKTSASGTQSRLFAQELNTLGQALQSGNLAAAQQAFSAMQRGWQRTSPNSTAASATSGVNVTV